jgi:uncharacterized protein (TIGR03437 family)
MVTAHSNHLIVWIGDVFPNGATDVSFSSSIAVDLNRDGKTDLAGISTRGVVSFLNISQRQPAVTVVSSASFAIGPVAPESLATAFGNDLALVTSAVPAGQALPTMLGETTVSVEDASGTTRPAPLLYVATGQVNFLIPAGTSSGTATITITTAMLGANLVHTAQVQISPVAPSLFTLNENGLAAAYVTRVRSGQPQTYEPLYTLQNGMPIAKRIDLGPAGDQVYLILYGTGVRNAGDERSHSRYSGIQRTRQLRGGAASVCRARSDQRASAACARGLGRCEHRAHGCRDRREHCSRHH